MIGAALIVGMFTDIVWLRAPCESLLQDEITLMQSRIAAGEKELLLSTEALETMNDRHERLNELHVKLHRASRELVEWHFLTHHPQQSACEYCMPIGLLLDCKVKPLQATPEKRVLVSEMPHIEKSGDGFTLLVFSIGADARAVYSRLTENENGLL